MPTSRVTTPVDDVFAGSEPAAIVCSQDACIGKGMLDAPRWSATMFFPLVMICGTGSIAVDDEEAFEGHLVLLQHQVARRGAVGFRTRITSELKPSEKMAVVGGFRDHVDEDGLVVSSSSMTWTLILTATGWKVNLIHFNDTRQDASVVSELCRDAGEIK